MLLENNTMANITLKQKIHRFLHRNQPFIKFIYTLIILNIMMLFLESFESIRAAYEVYFNVFEIASIIIFTIEYILRFWSADAFKRKEESGFKKQLKFATSWYGIIDLIAIIPFYLPFIIALDLRIFRILRLARLLRILKLGRYSKSLRIIGQIFKETKTELITTALLAVILLMLSSALMYYAENAAQPEAFASIAHALWWAVATLTTVGYGDIYPITALGKVIGTFIALIGIGFIALPTGIISSSFMEKIQAQKKRDNPSNCTCPKCGNVFKP